MRKIYSIFLIAVLLFPLMGTTLFLQHQKMKARKEAREMIISNLSQNDLTLLKFTPEESLTLLSWEHPGEFKYMGQMYDIVKTETIGDSIYYWCYADHKETRVNKAIEQAVAKASGPDPVRQNQTERLTDFLKTVYFQGSNSWNLPIPNILDPTSSILDLFYSSPSFSPPSPPPKES